MTPDYANELLLRALVSHGYMLSPQQPTSWHYCVCARNVASSLLSEDASTSLIRDALRILDSLTCRTPRERIVVDCHVERREDDYYFTVDYHTRQYS